MNRKKVMAATLVIVLIVGGIIWYNASRNAKDAARYAEGVEALDAGRYADAMNIFNDLKRRPYEDSEDLYLRAAEGRAEEMEAEGDWEGALELLRVTGGKGTYDILIRWASSLAAEERMDQAMALLEERIDSRDPFYLNRAKGRVMMAVGQYAEAEAYFRNMIETGGRQSQLAEELLECVYQQYLAAEAAGDEAEMDTLAMRAGAPNGEEPDHFIYVKLNKARRCVERGDYAGAAEELGKWRSSSMRSSYPKTAAAADALVDEIFSACVREGRWDVLYAGFPKEFKQRAAQDEAMAEAWRLASEGLTAMIGTDSDFTTLVEALPEDSEWDGEALFRVLAVASGDPTEQFVAAREWARTKGLEYALLSTAMDISAASAAGEMLPVDVKPELLAALPNAVERPGTGEEAIFAAAFREMYGPEADFIASEPRPGYYVVLADDGCKKTPFESFSDDPRQAAFDLKRLENNAAGILNVLAWVGGDSYHYRAVENPNTAALLVVLRSDFKVAGTGYKPRNLIRPEEADTYTVSAQCSAFNHQP